MDWASHFPEKNVVVDCICKNQNKAINRPIPRFRHPWSPNANHIGFDGSIQGLGSCLRPLILQTNHFIIFQESQVSLKWSICGTLLLELK